MKFLKAIRSLTICEYRIIPIGHSERTMNPFRTCAEGGGRRATLKMYII